MKTRFMLEVLKEGYPMSEPPRFNYKTKEAMEVDFAYLQQKYQTKNVEPEEYKIERNSFFVRSAKGGHSKKYQNVEVRCTEISRKKGSTMA